MSILDTLRTIKPVVREWEDDDRHHCIECGWIEQGYCKKQKFRPVDDRPRRCEDYKR